MMQALAELVGHDVSRETEQKLDLYARILESEAQRQNLIARSTTADLWDRHIADSAQLLRFAPQSGNWVDVGSGAGLPGIILAILGGMEMTLVEPRRLRAEFLQETSAQLQLARVRVLHSKIESVRETFDVVTARALAPLDKLLGITRHIARPGTLWVLPKGRNAKSELAEAERSWHYDLRVEPSCTGADSSILLLSNVRAKRKP